MKRILLSCFGLGKLPLAPGTWGSIPPAIIFALFCYYNTSKLIAALIMSTLALIASVICVKFAPVVIVATGENDPRQVVADEFAGQTLTFLPILLFLKKSPSASQIWFLTILGFTLFRLADILKPWPIKKLEKLPQGWGILTDDLLAGTYAAIVLLFSYQIGLYKYILTFSL